MNQSERLLYLINELVKEDNRYKDLEIPDSYSEQARLFRSLMNMRMPKKISGNFIRVQDEFLSNVIKVKGIVSLEDVPTIDEEFPTSSLQFKNKISICQGDITRLKVDAIVNAANSQMLGCFAPCHGCIDNAIHSASGIQLRDECYEIMKQQGHEEETGTAKITKAYNLPCKHVIHTVGPIVRIELTKELEDNLRSCYRSCLECAVQNEIRTIAFCCISTGEFHFPNERAAKIAMETVIEFLKENGSKIDRVIFNVFKDFDKNIYKNLVS
ncbi:protein-ADP-ribose hydrolase [Clostridium sp. SHJSY1]|uniref:protein-ADP-ribose hydrolase n=1 Tax=Clostridium sp. SHJSY1 TaxID=2942483 RepID=UPI002875BB20|nr:protein-ADP-ribose hydrolase [Clostridium sp. SHJSY1]MDS0524303.1 protein-ADP-ribose hydrolase [Clostridium sp. SHJSY1]